MLQLPFSVIMNKVFSAQAIHDLWREDEKDAAGGNVMSIRERCMQLLRTEDVHGLMSWQQQQQEEEDEKNTDADATTEHDGEQFGWEKMREEQGELLIHHCPVFTSWVSHYFDLMERGLLEKRARSTWDKGGMQAMSARTRVRDCRVDQGAT